MPLSIELTELYNLKGIHCKKGENIDDQTKFYKNEGSPKEVMDIKTFYEKQYLEKGKPITYIKFTV